MTFPFGPAATLHHGSIVGGGPTLPLTVRTAAAPGAYAVTFGRAAGWPASGLAGIRVTIAVEEGRIGVACLGVGDTGVLDEVHVDAGPSPAVVSLLGGSAADTGSVILRNVSTEGASLFTLIGLAGVEILAADDRMAAALSCPPAVAGWGRVYANHCPDLAAKARRRRLDQLTGPFILTWSDDVRMRITPDDRLSRVIYLSGTYEPRALRLLRAAVSPGDTLLDVGANAGIVSLAAAAWVGSAGRVVAIEQSAREFARLAANLALNDLPQVTAIRAAVAAEAGPSRLHVAAAPHSGLNTLGGRFAYAGVETEAVETVDAITLDALAGHERLERVRAIKLDVEGAEVHALAGATAILREQRPLVVLEVCATALAANGTTVGALEALLRDAGYCCFEIDDATGALARVAHVADTPDRNIAAAPIERASDLADAVRRLD
jgi:FkbM family methyltransferase